MEENNIEMPIKSYIKANYVEKKKIQEKIKGLEKQRNNVKIFKNIDEYDRCIGKIEILQELLEE